MMRLLGRNKVILKINVLKKYKILNNIVKYHQKKIEKESRKIKNIIKLFSVA